MNLNEIIVNNSTNIKAYLKKKNIIIDNIDELFNKITVEIGYKRDYPYAKVDKDNPFNIIISEDILKEDIYKWLNHEMIHLISNNQPTINDTNIGGVIVELNNMWIGQYLNEAITEYINQSIINSKYSDYYDRYIESLKYIIGIIGEDIVLNAYFKNNLNLIIEALSNKTNKSKSEILNYINSIDYLYETNEYDVKIK